MTPTQQLIEAKMGVPFPVYLSRLRSNGLSTRGIATEINRATGVTVTHETVRAWLAEEAEAS